MTTQATPAQISQASTILMQGGIVIFPTDTAFGIGCRIDHEPAVNRLFAVRKRPETQATPVLVSSFSMAAGYLRDPSDTVIDLAKQYWPGGLTIVAPCKEEKIYALVRGGKQTIGCRMPNHETALALISTVGVPLLGPSANFHQQPTPYAYNELDPELIKLVDYVLPGECSLKQASTVVDCSVQPYRIIRQGTVQLPATP